MLEKILLKAKEDKRGYEGRSKRHFVFNNFGISGGFYIDKGKEVPEEFTIYVKKGGGEDAECEGCDD